MNVNKMLKRINFQGQKKKYIYFVVFKRSDESNKTHLIFIMSNGSDKSILT